MNGFQIEGLNRTMKEFARIRDRVESDVKAEVASATVAVESGAVSRSAVDTGAYKSAWSYRMTMGGMVGEVYNPQEYAVHLEFGTMYMPAQPALIPSYENVRPQFFNNLERILKKV